MDLAGRNPDYLLQDLYEKIAQGNYPSWKLTVQVLTQKQCNSLSFSPFDPTKVIRVTDNEFEKLKLFM